MIWSSAREAATRLDHTAVDDYQDQAVRPSADQPVTGSVFEQHPKSRQPRRSAIPALVSAVAVSAYRLSLWSMRDLSDEDVRLLKKFLLGACDDVSRWLPPPQWEPVWQSEAARECANDRRGPDGLWAEDEVRTLFAGGAMYLHTILDCIQAIAATLTTDTTPYVTETLARAAMEAGAVLWWLLEPGIGARMRVARFWLIRASGPNGLLRQRR